MSNYSDIAKRGHAIVDDGSTTDSSVKDADSAAPTIRSDKTHDRFGNFLRLVDDFRAALDALCLYFVESANRTARHDHESGDSELEARTEMGDSIQRLAETLSAELLRLVAAGTVFELYGTDREARSERFPVNHALRVREAGSVNRALGELFEQREKAATTRPPGLDTPKMAADTLAKELPDFLQICHSLADDLRKQPDLYAVEGSKRSSFILPKVLKSRVSHWVGRFSYLAGVMISEALRIVVTAPNGEPLCALRARATPLPLPFKNIANRTNLSDGAFAPWTIRHVVGFVQKQLSAQAQKLLRTCSAHEQRKFDELSSLIERAAEEETEQMNVDREAFGESAKSREDYPYTALVTSAVSEGGGEGTLLVVWGATPAFSKCGLGDPMSKAAHFNNGQPATFSFRVGGVPRVQVIFVPDQDAQNAAEAVSGVEEHHDTRPEIFSGPATCLWPDPRDSTALMCSGSGSLFGSACNGVPIGVPKRFVFPSVDCRKIVEERLREFSSAQPLLRADDKGQLTPTVRLVTGNRVQPRDVEVLVRRLWDERPRPESELLQSLANKGEHERRRMLSAMRLVPFGAGDLLSADTLLIDLLNNKELDCVEWVDAVDEPGVEIPLALIRLHVVVEKFW